MSAVASSPSQYRPATRATPIASCATRQGWSSRLREPGTVPHVHKVFLMGQNNEHGATDEIFLALGLSLVSEWPAPICGFFDRSNIQRDALVIGSNCAVVSYVRRWSRLTPAVRGPYAHCALRPSAPPRRLCCLVRTLQRVTVRHPFSPEGDFDVRANCFS